MVVVVINLNVLLEWEFKNSTKIDETSVDHREPFGEYTGGKQRKNEDSWTLMLDKTKDDRRHLALVTYLFVYPHNRIQDGSIIFIFLCIILWNLAVLFTSFRVDIFKFCSIVILMATSSIVFCDI